MVTRRERVVLELDDQFTTGMARAAVAAAALDRALDGLDGSGVRFSRDMDTAGRAADRFGRQSADLGQQFNKTSGRMVLFAQAAAALGPALIPVGAVGISALAGLSAQFGFAAVGAGTAIAAFQGVGGALEAMNKAHLEPTAKNLEAARVAMEEISPAAQGFVLQLREMAPAMKALRDTAAEGLFPGLSEGLDSMESLLPKVERIVAAVSGELGSISADTGASLSSARWSEFFDFLATDAPSALRDMADAAGNTAHAMAELWMAFDPLNDDFSSWMVDATADLDAWASGLGATEGFQEFVDYIRTTGPQVADTLGAIGNALVQIVQAAAPIAGPVLAGIEAFAKAIAAVADSDLGTPIFGMIAALSALSLAMKASAAISRTTFGGPAVAGMKTQGTALKGLRADWAAYSAVQRSAPWKSTAAQMTASRDAAARLGSTLKSTAASAGKAGAVVGGLALATSGAADSMGVSNTVMLGLMGSVIPGWGTAVGVAAGAVLDLTSANDGLNNSLDQLSAMAGKVDFGTFNAQLAEAKRQLDDLSNVTGFGDLLGDTAKAFGGALQGKTVLQQRGDAQSQIDAAVATQNAPVFGPSAASSREGAAHAAALAAGYRLTAAAAREAAGGVAAFAANVKAANSAIGAEANLDAYLASLDNFDDLLKENGKTLNRHTEAGRANRAGLREIASGALAAAEGMKNFGRRTKFLDNARKGFVGAAMDAGHTRKEARALADQLGLLDRTKANPQVQEQGAKPSQTRVQKLDAQIKALKGKIAKVKEEGAAGSKGRVAALREQIRLLRDKKVYITTVVSKVSKAGYPGVTPADGGTIEGQRQPYGDKVHTMLAPGEEVISNRYGQADRYRDILKAINANAYADGGTVQHLANGGTARRRRGGGRRAELRRELERLKDAVAASTTAIEREKSVRESLTSKRSELSSTVTGAFKTDLFGDTNVWQAGGGAGGAFGILKADIAKANTFKSLLYGLSKRGLDGDALAELASTGDVGKAQAFASMSTKDLGTYESLYRQRASAAGAVGSYAGMAAYSAEQAAATKHLAVLVATQKAQTVRLHQIERAIRHQGRDFGRELNNRSAGARRRGNG